MSGTRGRSTRTARARGRTTSARCSGSGSGGCVRRSAGTTTPPPPPTAGGGIAFFGAFGEASDDAHRLLKVIAVAGAEARWADAMASSAFTYRPALIAQMINSLA